MAPPDTPTETSTKQRIRDAALAEFAAHGFRGASVRGIAAAAGVSPGLVQHHFPTKAHLRAACDERALEVVRSLQAGATPQTLRDPDFVAASYAALRPMLRYLSVTVGDGDDGPTWFDEFVGYTRRALVDGLIGEPIADSDDPEAVAAVFTAMQMGLTAHWGEVARALGVDPDDPSLLPRVTRARMYLVSERVLGDDIRRVALDAATHPEEGTDA